MCPETVWKTISDHALKLNLSKSNLLFSTFQDASPTALSMLVKDINGLTAGTVISQTLSRKRNLSIETENYVIEFPLTWNRTAILRSLNDGRVLAKYTRTGWRDRHQFEVIGFGVLNSESSSFNFKFRKDYKMSEKIIGTRQNYSAEREKGKLIVLPTDIPLAVRVFILAV